MTYTTEIGAATRTVAGSHGGVPIYPWGALLLISADWRIDGVSDNVGALIGSDPSELLGRPVASVFNSASVHAIRNRFALLGGSGGSERLYNLALTDDGRPLDLLLHLAGQQAVIELFPIADPEGIDVAAMVVRMARWIEGCDTLSSLGDRAAHAVRGIVGCDSVSIWKARGDGSPEPIACYAREGFECPPAPSGALGDNVQFLGSCKATPAQLVMRDSAQASDLSRTLLGGDAAQLRDHICANDAASGFLVPIKCLGRSWGWVVGVQRHQRSLALARLAVVEIFELLLAAEIGRLESSSP